MGSVLSGCGNRLRHINSIKISLEELKNRIKKIHSNTIKIIDSTYNGINNKATFIDKDFGEWQTTPHNILNGQGNKLRYTSKMIIPLIEIKNRLFNIYKNEITIIESTYKTYSQNAEFVDSKYGSFVGIVGSVLRKRSVHPKRKIANNIEKFGEIYPLLSKEIRKKGMKTSRTHYERIHWKTGEILDCQGGWEPKVIDYLNIRKINYSWHPKTFTMPNGKKYIPDLFLEDTQIWVEIKGYMRPQAKPKWEWFKAQFPTAELWNESKLKELGIL